MQKLTVKSGNVFPGIFGSSSISLSKKQHFFKKKKGLFESIPNLT